MLPAIVGGRTRAPSHYSPVLWTGKWLRLKPTVERARREPRAPQDSGVPAAVTGRKLLLQALCQPFALLIWLTELPTKARPPCATKEMAGRSPAASALPAAARQLQWSQTAANHLPGRSQSAGARNSQRKVQFKAEDARRQISNAASASWAGPGRPGAAERRLPSSCGLSQPKGLHQNTPKPPASTTMLRALPTNDRAATTAHDTAMVQHSASSASCGCRARIHMIGGRMKVMGMRPTDEMRPLQETTSVGGAGR